MLTLEKLITGYTECRKHKRNSFAAVEFEYNLEQNLCNLYKELMEKNYKIRGGVCFIVLFPKTREVWAASFRDRIVHHLVYGEISNTFFKTFIKDTYSCIPNRGSANAARTLNGYLISAAKNFNKEMYYMKADIKNFFVSINKDILYKETAKLIEEDWILRLIKQIIYHDPRNDVTINSPKWKFDNLPKFKSLWYTPDVRGLPIGNLTSQFFSNVYLNLLDQYIKNRWSAKYYCRYVDDFVILDENPNKLNQIHKCASIFIKKNLALELHMDKKTINRAELGIDFVGYTIKPNRIFLRQRTIKRIFKYIKKYKKLENRFDEDEINKFICSLNSYIGFLRGVDGYYIRKKIILSVVSLFINCDSEFTKIWAVKYE